MNNIRQYNISVIGLGYVGCVTSCCLAYLRHKVIGVDVNKDRIKLINKAEAPISEPLLPDFLKFGVKHKYLSATDDLDYAINNSDISFICVPTPPQKDGSCDLSYLKEVVTHLGKILASKNQEHIVVVRCTIPPGTMQEVVIALLEEHSGKKNNSDFYACFHPEFLREGTAIKDFFEPPKYIIGEDDNTLSGDRIVDLLAINKDQANVIRTSFKMAELVKYTDNVWHALKVSFANEIGMIADHYDTNGFELMNIFCQDKKLNISNYYLKPGLSYGGSCLPKDLQSMEYLIAQKNITLPIIKSIAVSNKQHLMSTYEFIKKHAHGKIGWFGVAFKDNTDDMRNSVHLELIAKMQAEHNIKVYDERINFRTINDSQKKILQNYIPDHSDMYIDDFIKLIDEVDTIVIGHPIGDYKDILLRYQRHLTIIDLANISIKSNQTHHNYHGLFW